MTTHVTTLDPPRRLIIVIKIEVLDSPSLTLLTDSRTAGGHVLDLPFIMVQGYCSDDYAYTYT